jgi:hypothetical protein
VAFEDDYRSYRDAIASAIRGARPHLEVSVVSEVEVLPAEVAYFDPHLVITSQPSPANHNGRLSWIQLSLDPNQQSLMCVDGEQWKHLNPSLEELLDAIDETERVIRMTGQRSGRGAC